MDKYLEKMKLKDILPGRKRYEIEGLAKDIEEQLGSFHFTSIITGCKSTSESYARLISIMNMGLLSQEMKQSANIIKRL